MCFFLRQMKLMMRFPSLAPGQDLVRLLFLTLDPSNLYDDCKYIPLNPHLPNILKVN